MDYSSKRTGCGIMLLLFCFIMICMTGCGKREREEFSVYTANDGMLTVSGPEADVDVWMELLRQTENVVCIKDESGPLYTATVRERLAERSDEELRAEMMACH